MPASRWSQRFFQSTRGRIIALLRRSHHTVEELAAALGLTDNAVRAHLAALERDGLVQQRGVRRGSRKPAYTYALTAEADALFPAAYAAILRGTLRHLARRHGRAEVEAVLRAVGRDLAEELAHRVLGDTVEARAALAAKALEDLGGLVEVRRENGHLLLQGHHCPLTAVVPEHPEACQLALALVQTLLQTDDVRERCARDPEPRCAFLVGWLQGAPSGR